jgi:glycosyltransferase involved in cell wall biosynthesis
MQVARLDDLPPPPPHLTGWPWTDAGPSASEPPATGWPLISLVTPTLNQGAFIEATLRSVLLQRYPRLEYIVIDGGSTDQTLHVLQQYSPWLSYWSSEPDHGQSHAINKGLSRSSGDIFNWINSDDCLAPGALWEVARRWAEVRPHLLVGRGQVIDAATDTLLHDWHPRPPKRPLDFIETDRVVMAQPATFLDRRTTQRLGGLREDLHYVLDWELYVRFAVTLRSRLVADSTPALLSRSYLHDAAKTVRQPHRFRQESLQVLRSLYSRLSVLERLRVMVYVVGTETQSAVTEVSTTRIKRRRRLAQLLVQRPQVALSRFYWGAVRAAAGAKLRP